MSTEKRDAVVKDFTNGKVKVLVTSVMLTLLRDSLQCQQVNTLCKGSGHYYDIITHHYRSSCLIYPSQWTASMNW